MSSLQRAFQWCISAGLCFSLSGCAGNREPTIVRSHPVQQLVLENGLTVAWEEDHRQPLVAIEARILGGLRGEGRYLGTGITHFLEHMIFKGTPSRPTGTIDQEVRRYGGTINAFTSHDFTGVNLFVESRHLHDALGMLADILQHSTFPDEEFAKERAVVISEIQMNQDDPERRIQQLFWNQHLLVHPYRHPILGYQPLLEGLTVGDMRAYYRAQYIPNNIVLTCVGDLDGAAFPDLAKEVFAAWPRGAPYQIIVPEEPPPVSVRVMREALPVQAAYLLIGFPSVRLADPDLYPLDVLASIVGRGRTARLHEALVRKQRVAHAVSASNYTPLDPGAFSVFLRADPDKADAAVEAALRVLEEVAQKGVTAEELKKAKRQVVADYVFQHQTIEAEAGDMASNMAMTGDPTYSKRYVEEIERVTAEGVRAAAARYLQRAHMTLVAIEPPREPAHAAAAEPAAARPATKTALANGLTVLTGVNRQLPMAVIVAASRGGVRVETEETQGLSNLVAQLLVKGTKRRGAQEIAEAVESLGGILEPFSGRDGFGLSLQVLAQDVDEGLALVHELLTESVFSEDELALQRDLIVKELQARDDDVFDVGNRLLRRTLFARHPYRFDPLGTQESVARLTREQCLAFANAWVVSNNLVLTVFGDIQEAQVLKDAQRRFSTMPSGAVRWPAELPPDPLSGVRQAAASVPKEQSVILVGFRGTEVTAPDRYALDTLTAVLSGMSGRLFQAVRERQGLAYTLGAYHVPGWDPGYLVVYAATRPGDREQVLKTVREQLQIVVDHGVTEDELDQAKRYLIGIHRMNLQQLSGLAQRATLDELYGLGYDAWTRYEPQIQAVTLPMVQDAARRYLTLSERAEVVVGPNGH